jgi:hypothetical protein
MCLAKEDPEDRVEEEFGFLQRTTQEVFSYIWEVNVEYAKPCSLATTEIPTVPLSQWWKHGRFDQECAGSLEHRSTMAEWLLQPVGTPFRHMANLFILCTT